MRQNSEYNADVYKRQEVQGTAEQEAFTRAELDALLDLAAGGIAQIHAAQRAVLITPPAPRPR